METGIAGNLQRIRQRLGEFERKYARERGSVQLLAVSKTQAADRIAEAFTAGQRDFGENYLQEALDKQAALAHLPIRWHFIGPIQSNKTRAIAERFAWVHSVDRLRIARRLAEQRQPGCEPLKVLLQVNLCGEASKSGMALAELESVAREVSAYSTLSLRGLMTIPAPGGTFDEQRRVFRRLAQARDRLLALGLKDCRELSMGMSADFEAAVAEGATMIRIGTDIFGPRESRQPAGEMGG